LPEEDLLLEQKEVETAKQGVSLSNSSFAIGIFPLNTILVWNINIIINKKYDNNNIITVSRAYFLHNKIEEDRESKIRIEIITRQDHHDICIDVSQY
jgi:hypothetical protein